MVDLNMSGTWALQGISFLTCLTTKNNTMLSSNYSLNVNGCKAFVLFEQRRLQRQPLLQIFSLAARQSHSQTMKHYLRVNWLSPMVNPESVSPRNPQVDASS